MTKHHHSASPHMPPAPLLPPPPPQGGLKSAWGWAGAGLKERLGVTGRVGARQLSPHPAAPPGHSRLEPGWPACDGQRRSSRVLQPGGWRNRGVGMPPPALAPPSHVQPPFPRLPCTASAFCSCHGQLAAPKIYRKFREVGKRLGCFWHLFRPPENVYNIF